MKVGLVQQHGREHGRANRTRVRRLENEFAQSRQHPTSTRTAETHQARELLRGGVVPARLQAGMSTAGMLGFPIGMLGLALGWWGVEGYLYAEATSILAFFLGLGPAILKD